MPVYIVEVRDEITIARKAQLIIVAATQSEAEEQARDRATAGAALPFDEEQTAAQPYEFEVNQSPSEDRLCELLERDRQVGPMDADELKEFDELKAGVGLNDSELLDFRNAYPPGTKFPQGVDEEEEASFVNYYRCPRCRHEWTDEWSCMCDDDCPKCGNRHISPSKSEDANA